MEFDEARDPERQCSVGRAGIIERSIQTTKGVGRRGNQAIHVSRHGNICTHEPDFGPFPPTFLHKLFTDLRPSSCDDHAGPGACERERCSAPDP